MHVAMHKPAYKPARSPNAHVAKAAVRTRECNGGQGDGDARGPIVDAKNLVGPRHCPIDKRGLFEIGDAVQTSRNPVAGLQHVPRNLRLHRVHIVHERRRRNDAP